MDDAEALMPVYLRFVKGVIDSNDLPLNVSRELLQESRDVKAIREGSTKRVLSMLEGDGRRARTRREQEKVRRFWKDFGVVMKEGIGEDFANRERLTKLLRFASTAASRRRDAERLASRLRQAHEGGQEAIYYVTADIARHREEQPAARDLQEEGIEVLLLTDRVDEWCSRTCTSSTAIRCKASPRERSTSASSPTRRRRSTPRRRRRRSSRRSSASRSRSRTAPRTCG
jgi:molecular chaperone HtpG